MCQRAHNIQLCEYLWYVVLKKKKSELCLSQLWFKEPLMWGDLQFVWVIRPILKIRIYAFKRSECFPDLPISEDFSYCHSSEVPLMIAAEVPLLLLLLQFKHMSKTPDWYPWVKGENFDLWLLFPLYWGCSCDGETVREWIGQRVDIQWTGLAQDSGQHRKEDCVGRSLMRERSQLAFPRSEPTFLLKANSGFISKVGKNIKCHSPQWD